jgi:hypothetical protein
MKKDRTKSSLPTPVFASEGASLGQLVLPELLIGARRGIRTVSGLTRRRAERHWSQTCARVTQKARSA